MHPLKIDALLARVVDLDPGRQVAVFVFKPACIYGKDLGESRGGPGVEGQDQNEKKEQGVGLHGIRG